MACFLINGGLITYISRDNQDECTDEDLENFMIMTRPFTMHMLPEPDDEFEDASTDAGFIRKLQTARLQFLCSNGTCIHCYAYQYVAKHNYTIVVQNTIIYI